MTRKPWSVVLVSLGLVASALATASQPTAAAAVVDTAASAVSEVVVRIDPAVTSITAINAAIGTSTVATSIAANGAFLLRLPPRADRDLVILRLGALPGVVWAVANTTLTPPEVDASRIYAWRIYAWTADSVAPVESRYAAGAVDLSGGQAISTGAGVVVAVLDTGVQLNPTAHPALARSLVPGADLVDGDSMPAETQNGLDDDHDGRIDEGAGHGTHVAGIVHQVAPGASIMPVRILDDDGTGTIWNATEGMYWAAAHGARIVNMSLGTTGSSRPLRDAVTALAAQGVMVVAAAGNNGAKVRMYPAAAPEALAVGSVGAGDVVSSFSNFGRWVDVMAPGENIHSTYAFPAGSYAMNSGTSMATPWAAGEAALVASVRPLLGTAGIIAVIKAGATPIDSINPSVAGLIGAGRISIGASLRSL